MALTSKTAFYGVQAVEDLSGQGITGQATYGIGQTNVTLPGSDKAASFRVEVDGAGTVEIDLETLAVTPTGSGTAQVETVTITAAAGITSNGNIPVTITGARVTGSPVTVQVPVTTALTTAAIIAAEIANNATVLSTLGEYGVAPVGATIEVDDLTIRTNDPTLNIAIGGGLGVTAAPTSANTTVGVAPVACYRLAGTTYAGENAEGGNIPDIDSFQAIIVRRVDGTGTMIAEAGGGEQRLTLGPTGAGQIWDSGDAITGMGPGKTLEFSSTSGPCSALVTLVATAA